MCASQNPVHYVTKHLQQGIESDHFRVKKNMPKIGGFQSFKTARRTIAGFVAMPWLKKGFGFSGDWTACSRASSDFKRLTKHESRPVRGAISRSWRFATGPYLSTPLVAHSVDMVSVGRALVEGLVHQIEHPEAVLTQSVLSGEMSLIAT